MNRRRLRPFNGSLGDAQGILSVERSAFNESPYTPQQIIQLLSRPEHRAWVAEAEGKVVGFASAFSTRTLDAHNWEIDLLAIDPAHRGQGIATALIRRAAADAPEDGIDRVRAVVAAENRASRRAFEAAGFAILSGPHHLMRCPIAGAAPRPPVPGMEAVRPLQSQVDARGLLDLAAGPPRSPAQVMQLAALDTNTFLALERDGRLAAFAELIWVRTLLYAGVWIETLAAPRPGDAGILVAVAIARAKDRGSDEIGCLVPAKDWRLRQATVGQGFASEGEYLIVARSP
jgi:ribosomal protein S18 acetylase RimI-like enzyme